jgi:sugar O-acyltransferase (sialic acid O-acetyltransferase NeuD family)
MKKKVVIIGAGGFGREVLDVIYACNETKGDAFDPLGFVVDSQYGTSGTIVNGLPILGGFEWLEKNRHSVFVSCGVGSPQHRYHLIKRAREIGCQFFSVVHPSAIVTNWVQIGVGVVITAGCILTNQIKIGNHVHINLASTIGHDVVVDDFSTLAPGVHISGNVTIAEGAYIGTGANILEKITVGEWSIIGAGSTIVKEVLANTTVVGVPGKEIKVREAGWYREKAGQ